MDITLWLFNSSPWKITICNRLNHLFLWAIYTMAMLNNQRVMPTIFGQTMSYS